MIDGRTLDLDLAGGPVALEVFPVVGRVPEAEFHVRKELQRFRCSAFVRKCEPVDFAGIREGNESFLFRCDPVLFPGDDRIAQAVAALVGIDFGTGRLPAGIPDARAVLYIEIDAVRIEGDIVVAVAGNAEELGVLIESIAAGRIGDEAEEVPVPEVVDPGERGPRRRNDVLPCGVVEVTVLHGCVASFVFKNKRKRFRSLFSPLY